MAKEQRDIEFLKDSECGNCRATDRDIKKAVAANPGLNVKKIRVDSKEGQEMIKKYGITKIPYIRDCPKGVKDEKACTVINQHDPTYWEKYYKKN